MKAGPGARRWNGDGKTRVQHKNRGSNIVFDAACQKAGLPPPVKNFPLAGCHEGVLSYCFPEYEIAILVGNDVMPVQLLNQAAIEGWRVLICDREGIEDGTAIRMVQSALLEGIR